MVTEHLIQKFFNKDCTADEAEQVILYLQNNPAMLEKYLSRKEWDSAEPVNMDQEFWDQAWLAIQTKTRNTSKIIWLKRAAAAAVLIITLGAVYNYFFTREKQQPVIADTKTSLFQQRKITLNNSDATMKVTFADNSHVDLSPGSVIVYYVPFDSNKRDISLVGKGRFRVTRDERRPFTVFAGGLATTALGTEFTINTRERFHNNITVKLHTGKVMIKAAGKEIKALTKNIYLEAGQQLEFNESQMLVEVGKIKTEPIAAKTETNKIRTNRKLKKNATIASGGLSFVNTPLTEVLKKLSDYFNTNIEYDALEIQSMNFTGTISKNDSLQVVLRVISQMNDLEMAQDGASYKLRRLQQ